MRIIEFGGIAPKHNRRKLNKSFAVRAVNVDLYGEELKGLPAPVEHTQPVDVYGNKFTGEAGSLHIQDGLPIAFKEHTFTALDPLRRYGEQTFLFVQDGTLWRTAPNRILLGKPPTKVGIDFPCTAPSTTVLPKQGCEAEHPDPDCTDNDGTGCEDYDPPQATSYRMTYVTDCGDESAPSPASEPVDVYNGDGVALVDTNTPPENATCRRWYRSVVGSQGDVVWLLVAEMPIGAAGMIDSKCVFELSDILQTEQHMPPPDCIKGVANFGRDSVVVWTDKTIQVSQCLLPHAFRERDKQRVYYNIVAGQSFIDFVEDSTTYKVAFLTDGLPYVLLGDTYDNAELREIQAWQPCSSAKGVCFGEGTVYYVSPHGLCTIGTSGVSVISSSLFTEYEWGAYNPSDLLLCYWSGRLWGFNKQRGFQIQLSKVDQDRDEAWTELDVGYSAAYATPDHDMIVYNGAAYLWAASKQRRMHFIWKSRFETQAGLWYPVSIKVERNTPDLFVPANIRTALDTHVIIENGCVDSLMIKHPEYRKYYTALSYKPEPVRLTVFKDDYEHYTRTVTHNKPVRIRRSRRALHWAVQVEGTDVVITEIHVQTSNEDLTQEGGAV